LSRLLYISEISVRLGAFDVKATRHKAALRKFLVTESFRILTDKEAKSNHPIASWQEDTLIAILLNPCRDYHCDLLNLYFTFEMTHDAETMELIVHIEQANR
jgi:hypothetical protein